MATHSTIDIAGVRVYAPTGDVDTNAHALAPRLKSLKGMRLGILDNHKEFSDAVLHGVSNQLAREYGVEVKIWRKDYLGRASPHAKEMAAQCDAVINGVGH